MAAAWPFAAACHATVMLTLHQLHACVFLTLDCTLAVHRETHVSLCTLSPRPTLCTALHDESRSASIALTKCACIRCTHVNNQPTSKFVLIGNVQHSMQNPKGTGTW